MSIKMSEFDNAERAASLETEGIRDAAKLQAGGERDAATLQTAGKREALVLQTAGQRRINLIWEITQAIVAISITGTTMYSVISMLHNGETDKALTLLSAAFFLIIGFYFSRTNHTKIGGITGEGER